MNEGWIKLHRRFLEWEWFDSSDMIKLFIYILLKVNHKENTWRGIKIERGQFLTGLNTLNKETKISIQSLRTCLRRLESTKEINMQVTNKYRIITACNYESYQDVQQATNKQTNKQLTSNQQASNKQVTTNKNDKNVNKEEVINFYELEKQKAGGKYKDKYIHFVGFLYGKNDMDKPLNTILKLEEQVTFKNFCTLMEKIRDVNNEKGDKKVKLLDMIMGMHNKPKYIKGNKSLYLTLNSWINRER